MRLEISVLKRIWQYLTGVTPVARVRSNNVTPFYSKENVARVAARNKENTPKSETNYVGTTPAGSTSNTFPPNNILAHAGMLSNIRFLDTWLGNDAKSIIAFSETCKAARGMSSEVRNKQALKALLTAVVEGNKAKACKIITSRPELLLEKSATVTDLSGKEIKGLTPLQAAICAGDEDMAQMLIEVFYQKIFNRVPLSTEPELVIRNQFEEIYKKGNIDLTTTLQKKKARYFKDSTLQNLFDTINAATPEQVKYELNNPGQERNNPYEELNAALRNFRKYFADKSKAEQIFNPYDLLAAFELYDRQFNNFGGNPDSGEQWNRRRLFWRQVIGYIQRHLPACYLQAFAQGVFYIVQNNQKLERHFEFKYDKGFYMRAIDGDLNNLGCEYAGGAAGAGGSTGGVWGAMRSSFQSLLRTKKSGLEILCASRTAGNDPRITCRAGA